METTPRPTRLLEIAASLFRTKGYAATTTREVAAQLGVKSATLYHYLSKKEDLLYALCVDSLANARRETERIIAQHPEPIDRLRAVIRAHVATVLRDQDKQATQLIELRALSEDRRASVLELRRDYEVLIRSIIADAQAASSIRRDIEPKHLCLALLGLLNWSVFWYRPDSGLSPEQLGDLFAALFIEGAAAPSGEPGGTPKPTDAHHAEGHRTS